MMRIMLFQLVLLVCVVVGPTFSEECVFREGSEKWIDEFPSSSSRSLSEAEQLALETQCTDLFASVKFSKRIKRDLAIIRSKRDVVRDHFHHAAWTPGDILVRDEKMGEGGGGGYVDKMNASKYGPVESWEISSPNQTLVFVRFLKPYDPIKLRIEFEDQFDDYNIIHSNIINNGSDVPAIAVYPKKLGIEYLFYWRNMSPCPDRCVVGYQYYVDYLGNLH